MNSLDKRNLMDGPRSLIDGPSGYRLMSIGHTGSHGGNRSGGGQDAGAGGGFGGGGRRGQTRHERAMDRRGDRGGGGRQQMYPGIRQGERIPEYRQRMAQQKRQAAIDAERKAKAEAAKKAQEEAAARQAQQQQRLAQEAAARQAADAAAAKQAQEEAARKAAEEARQKAEQQRLAAIEEQRRKDAEEAAKQRAAEEARRQADLQRAQALGTVVTTGPMASLNRPADPLPRYRGYTPMDYDASKTGSLTDQYARMLNVPFFQPFVAQDQIEGPTPQDSIFGIDSLMPTYTFDPATGLASDPYAPPQQATYLQQGGRVRRDMGGIIGFMDEPINIMYPSNQNNVLHGGISSILKKYKEIRSEL